jgi:hypothetical protein
MCKLQLHGIKATPSCSACTLRRCAPRSLHISHILQHFRSPHGAYVLVQGAEPVEGHEGVKGMNETQTRSEEVRKCKLSSYAAAHAARAVKLRRCLSMDEDP